jgi:hypothetical protein
MQSLGASLFDSSTLLEENGQFEWMKRSLLNAATKILNPKP